MRFKPVAVPEVPGTVEVEVSPDGIVFHGADGPLRTLLFTDISLLDTHDPTWKRIVGCRDWFAKPNPKFYLRTGPDSPRWLFEPSPGTAITLVMPADDYRPWDEFQSALPQVSAPSIWGEFQRTHLRVVGVEAACWTS